MTMQGSPPNPLRLPKPQTVEEKSAWLEGARKKAVELGYMKR